MSTFLLGFREFFKLMDDLINSLFLGSVVILVVIQTCEELVWIQSGVI